MIVRIEAIYYFSLRNLTIVLYRHLLLSFLVALGAIFNPIKAQAQAVIPYTPDVSSEVLAPYGSQLLQDAVQLIRFQEYELALSRARLAARLVPNQYETWFILGTLHLQQRENQAGVDALVRARELAPDEAEVLFALGNAYFQLGDYESAITEIRAGLAINSENHQALFDLGNSYLQLRQFPDAIASYQQSFDLDEAFWPSLNNIGLAEYEQGNKDRAIALWRDTIAIDESQAEPYLAIAVAMYSQGQQTEAIRMATQALQLDGKYGNEEYLIMNLWGDNLMEDTRTFFANPRMVRVLENYLVPLEE
ncbi:Tetratricopeptide TPR_1 repeat-containing protein [Cyanobacterium stanieri PCC 7202]|uniref:Tetratricopeptide TPR_1 repeat-containing protein n=1 Tax=Cyanobacterium stanieri (strain ATCC 29140 / PCC 7202) TaxID=292563 RepID=K9YMJ3_CYASC|nr:Tetratricopeptide TPR_1 repeat-containing protein [Cyanobacterium stanieri PCC 7202]